MDASALWSELQSAARELGFSQIGVTGVNLSEAEPGLEAWLAAGFHGSMNYMASHGLKRARPAELVPGTVSVITVRMDYLPGNVQHLDADVAWQELEQPQKGVVSVYARGRDYHKVLRSRLQKLQERMAKERLTLVPLSMLLKNGRVKVELALAQGRKHADKRQAIAQRDSDMDAKRAMAARRPQTMADMARIPGVGAVKLESWGPAFLAAITASAA